MKKNNPILFCLLLLTLAFSCNNEPIFYGIEQEINLEDPIVMGNVYTVTEAGSVLYAANGKIFSKNSAETRGWVEAAKPEGFIIRTASDSTHLYALTSDKVLYASPLTANLVWVSLGDSIVELFDNNALQSSDKKAFITKSDAVYQLINGTVSDVITSGGASTDSITAEFINGQTYFSSSILFTSDREAYVYRASSTGIEYSTDNINWIHIAVTIEAPMSLEYLKNADASSLLAGTETGIVQLPITAGLPSSSTSPLPGSNADSCFGKSRVPYIFAYPFAQGIVYVSSVKTDNTKSTKFWAYYPERDNWNLE